MNIIETLNLTKYYGKARGIIDLNLEVFEGEIFGFIGPNGAGKSTTIRTLLSFIYPTSGIAKVFGLDCQKDSFKIKKEIGYLPAEVNYYDNMKVKDLLKYSASFYYKNCDKRIKELCDIFEVETNRKIEDLSMGNKKKVSIVQSLLHEPKLLILDEPTGGLDPLMQNRFFEVLKSESEKGTTIFFSSHILSEVQKMCNRVAIIRQGKILKIEQIDKLRETTFRKVRVELSDGENPDILKVDGMHNKNIKDNKIDFIFNGSINTVIQKLNTMKVKNLWIDEPSLDEIFMHYYITEDN